MKELSYEDLLLDYSKNLNFKTTNDINEYNGIVGQKGALDTVKKAMQITYKGFNLFVCGQVGMGKTPYVLSIVNELAKQKQAPNDICYIHNFESPNEPVALSLPAGKGREFAEDMNRFLNSFKTDIANIFGSENFEKEKNVIVSKYENMKNEMMRKFDEYTSSLGFKVKTATDGIYFSPIHEGNVLNEEQFNALSDEIKKEFEEKSPKIQEDTMRLMKDIEALEKECTSKVSEWLNNMTSFVVSKNLNNLKLKYKGNLKIQNYLYGIQNDIIKNIEHLKATDKGPTSGSPAMVQQMRNQYRPWETYKVNLLVNNEKQDHAPVVVCSNPTYYDLFGKLEYENQMGCLRTNHNMLKAGDIHKANGGYLLVHARDLLINMTLWEAFKRVIRNGEIVIDSSRDMATGVTMVGLKPEPVKIDMQVVLFGSEMVYQQLYAMDPDFRRLFKMKADFEDSIPRNEETVRRNVEYIAYVVKKNKLLPFKASAVEKILVFSSKEAGDKEKFTAMQMEVTDIVIESAYIAKNRGATKVEAEDVEEAISSKSRRYGKYNENLRQMIEKGAIMIDTKGEVVGRINGLTVMPMGEVSYGKPVRITANTYLGKSGVVNIEREVSLSGTTHSKGVMILSAFLGEKFGQNIPLCFNASICFEQLYNGVDGDSASSTELYAILSSLSGIPIRQSIAVTGSVNQKGDIQPIGGATQKIEGYFEICKMQGLTGEQGVIIPVQNVNNLVLSDEIKQAVKNGKFHIYPVATIDEGIEILTGVKAGKYIEGSGFEENTVYAKVYEKLKQYAITSQKFEK